MKCTVVRKLLESGRNGTEEKRFEAAVKVGVQEVGSEGLAACCVRGEERVELLLGWWAQIVSHPGTVPMTAATGNGRKYLLKDSLSLWDVFTLAELCVLVAARKPEFVCSTAELPRALKSVAKVGGN